MRIDVTDKYAIVSDSHQYIVAVKSTAKSDNELIGRKVGDETLSHIGFLSSIEECYQFLFKLMIRESDANGWPEVMEEVKRVEKILKESIKI